MSYKFLSTILGIDANFTGNVGVGTTTPSYKLDVNGTGRFQSTLTADGQINTNALAGFNVKSGTDTLVSLGYSGGALLNRLTGTNFYIAQNGSPELTINTSGNVGIGTTSPISYVGYKILSLDGVTGTFTSYSQNNVELFRVGADSNRPFLYSTTGTPMDFYMSTTVAMKIASSGNVLIGTTTDAGYKLQVNGDGFINNGNLYVGTAGSSYPALITNGGPNSTTSYYGSGQGNGSWDSRPNGNAPYIMQYHTGLTFSANSYYGGIRFYNQAYPNIYSSTLVMSITDNNVGIGTTTPGGKLDIVGTSGTVRIETGGNSLAFTRNDANYISAKGGTSSFLVFETGLAERMRITADGNVGIGTTSPQLTTSGRGNLTINGTSQSILALSANNVWSGYLFANASFTEIGAQGYCQIVVNGGGTIALRVASSGNVLIGTTTDAGYKLDVYGSDARLFSTGGAVFSIQRGGSGYATAVNYKEGVNSYWYTGMLGGGYNYTINDSNYGINKLSITQGSTWGVGIGTISPSQKLQVGDGTGTGNQYVRVYSSASDIYIGQSGSGLFGLSANSAGNIVQDNPSYPLAIGTIFSQPVIFGTYNVERMRIASGGNLLIGTTTDAGYKLDVNGTQAIRGSLSIISNSAYQYFQRNNNSYSSAILFQTSSTFDWFIGQNPLGTSTSDFSIYSYGTSSVVLNIARSTGVFTLSSLSGSGTRMVVADSSGTLSTQAIPGGGAIKAYGSWQSNNTQLSPANNFPTPVIYDVVNFNNNISVDLDFASQYTLITMLVDGVFNIQFSFQFRNLSSSDQDVYVWFRKNGQTQSDDIANSNTLISVPAKHGSGTPGHTVAAWNFFVQATANDYYQIVWATSDKNNVSMEYIPPTPFGPGSPSSILTVNKVD